jgi:hypothetical protein
MDWLARFSPRLVHSSNEGAKTRPTSGPGISLAHTQREQEKRRTYEKINDGPSITCLHYGGPPPRLHLTAP